MKTVTQISRLTGVSVRTLHHYDAIGLLPPSQVTEAGYRLYDEDALERLHQILVFREIGFPLKKIQEILDAPDHVRNQALSTQLTLLEEKVEHLKNRITLARGIQMIGVKFMEFEGFDINRIDDYASQAKALYGKTQAYQEYARKSQSRTQAQEQALGDAVMDFFVRLGTLKDQDPAGEAVQKWVAQLQTFFTEHYYTCTPQILKCLGESYAGGGTMTENIDRAGGTGTGAFAKAAIDIYCK